MHAWFIHIPFILAIVAYLIRKYEAYTFKWIYRSGIILKICAAIALGLIYKLHYEGGDTFNFFQNALFYKQTFQEDFNDGLHTLLKWQGTPEMLFYIQPRALIVSKIVFLINLFTFENYWISAIYLSLICFWSISTFIETARNNELINRFATIPLLLTPSFVFWSSGILKESIAIASIFFILNIVIKLTHNNKINVREALLFCISLSVLFLIKYYIAAILIPFLMCYFIFERFKSYKYYITPTFLLLTILVSLMHPNLHFKSILEVIVSNHDQLMAISQDAQTIKFTNLTPSLSSFVENLPLALTSAFTRSYLFEEKSILVNIVAIENLMILLILIATFLTGIINKKTPSVLATGILLYCIVLSVILTLSTPVIGTLARYKVYYLPFLLMLCFEVISTSSYGRKPDTP